MTDIINFPTRQQKRVKSIAEIRAYIRGDTRHRSLPRLSTETDEEYARRVAADRINKTMWYDHRDEFESMKKCDKEKRGAWFRQALEAELKSRNGVQVWRGLIAGKAQENTDVLDLF